MSELRALMLQRAKAPAKVHSMELEMQEPPVASSAGDHGGSSFVKGVERRSMAPSSVDTGFRGKQRPFSEPMLKKNPPHGSQNKNDSAPSVSNAPSMRYARSGPSKGPGSVASERVPEREIATREEREAARQERADRFAERAEKRMVQRDRDSDAASVASKKPRDYGKVPGYIQKMKSDRALAKQKEIEDAKRIVPPPGFRQVSEEERRASVENLRFQKRELEDEMHRRAPFRAETTGQQANERRLNANLKRVEEGLALFSKEVVFVPEDCGPLSPVRKKETPDDEDVFFQKHLGGDEDEFDYRRGPARRSRESRRPSRGGCSELDDDGLGGRSPKKWINESSASEWNNKYIEPELKKMQRRGSDYADEDITSGRYESSRQPASPNRRRDYPGHTDNSSPDSALNASRHQQRTKIQGDAHGYEYGYYNSAPSSRNMPRRRVGDDASVFEEGAAQRKPPNILHHLSSPERHKGRQADTASRYCPSQSPFAVDDHVDIRGDKIMPRGNNVGKGRAPSDYARDEEEGGNRARRHGGGVSSPSKRREEKYLADSDEEIETTRGNRNRRHGEGGGSSPSKRRFEWEGNLTDENDEIRANRGNRGHVGGVAGTSPPKRKFEWENHLVDEDDEIGERGRAGGHQQRVADIYKSEQNSKEVMRRKEMGLDTHARAVQPPGGRSTISLMWGDS